MYRIITTFITIEIRGKSVNIRIIMHYKSHSTHMSQLVKGHNSIFQWSFLRSFEVDIGCRHDFIAPRLCTVRPLLSWGNEPTKHGEVVRELSLNIEMARL